MSDRLVSGKLGNFMWSIVARGYNATYSPLMDEIDEKIFAFLASHGKLEGKVALDAGAGTGVMSVKCIQHGMQEVYALDKNFTMLSMLSKDPTYQENLGRIHLYGGDFNEGAVTRLAENVGKTFDAVFFKRCLYSGEDEAVRVLKEAYEVVSPGGHLVVVHPEKDLATYCKNEEGGFAPLHFMRRFGSFLIKAGGAHYMPYTSQQLTDICGEVAPNTTLQVIEPSRPAYNIRVIPKLDSA